MHILKLIKRWFSLQDTISREEYLLTGLGLMLFKYAVEAWIIGHYTNKFYAPLDFVNPLLSARSQFISGAPKWLGMAWVLWTVPFIWIALTMSFRRAMDADISPWLGLLVLIPVLNLGFMLLLATIRKTKLPTSLAARQFDEVSLKGQLADGKSGVVRAALAGIAAGMFFFLGMALLGIYVFGQYGAVVFIGTPVTSGAVSAYFFNRKVERSLAATLGHSLSVVLASASFLLAFGLEGGICIAMALPIILPAAVMGSYFGWAIAREQHMARKRKDQGIVGCLLVLPFLAGVETFIAPQTEFEVLSVVEITAPPERVWQCVVSFPEITERPEWFFRWGISCPKGARIEGEGAGAMRYCDFTTGTFVEPVTTWDPPRLLAFKVNDQPDPMTELSPYRHIHPPHLDGSFRSTHGEFRLVPLADGGTRLEGRTWYKLEIYPHAYWTLWTDWLVHRIHGRVLRHIKQLAEVTEFAGIPTDGKAIMQP